MPEDTVYTIDENGEHFVVEDYEPSVCMNCGHDEHSPEELAACVESILGPGRSDDE